ncbi:MAG: response regulator [Nitrospira sp.]|nr:response regulator [bacterium]MBL7048454.1 response regulator [Nitrospira sp.]
MRILVVEDDVTSRKILQKFLSEFGETDTGVNGEEAISAFKTAHAEGKPYELICLDIMMPIMDGQEALQQIREFEKENGIAANGEVKIIMTTALNDPKNIFEAFYTGGAISYLVKPIDKQKLLSELKQLGCVV